MILCAGAYNSPQLLMLSGIGPAEHLRALGVDVVLDQPAVGANLQDHLNAGSSSAPTTPTTLDDGRDGGERRAAADRRGAGR